MKCRNCKHNTLHEEFGEQYSWCKIVHDNLYIDIERECEHYAQATNADRIRSMTDEELSEWVIGIMCRTGKPYMEIREKVMRDDEFLTWLKQEVEE